MRFSTRFTQAVFTLMILEYYKEEKVTSTFIADKMKGNPVVYRNLLAQLKESGFVTIAQGKGKDGTKLAIPLSQITLLDVLISVEDTCSKSVFKNHSKFAYVSTNAKLINDILLPYYEQSLNASFKIYSEVTLGEIMELFLLKLKEQNPEWLKEFKNIELTEVLNESKQV